MNIPTLSFLILMLLCGIRSEERFELGFEIGEFGGFPFNTSLGNEAWYLDDNLMLTMGVRDVWNLGYNGSGVSIAIVDAGTDLVHIELFEQYNFGDSYDFVDDKFDAGLDRNSPGAPCVRDFPSRAPCVRDFPSSAPCVRDFPSRAPCVRNSPSSAPCVRDFPSRARCVRNSPSSAPCVRNFPSSAPFVRDFPSTAPCVRNSPSSAPDVRNFPSSAPCVRNSPSRAPCVRNSPSSAPCVRNFPSSAPLGVECAGLAVGTNSTGCVKGIAYGASYVLWREQQRVSPLGDETFLDFYRNKNKVHQFDFHDQQVRKIALRVRQGLPTEQPDDETIAKAVNASLNAVDIYSSSWGPIDDGKTIDDDDKLGPLSEAAIQNAINTGRDGKGSIFLFSSGSGGDNFDDCNVNGYVSSPYTIAIGTVDVIGSTGTEGEPCASILAVTYGGRMNQTVKTTAYGSTCTDFYGSEAATPIAAGIIALTLEANPNLTWRDVQHLIVKHAQPFAAIFDYTTNGAGKLVNHDHGFGLMDAKAMVTDAVNWTLVPPQTVCESELLHPSSRMMRERFLDNQFTPFTINLGSVHFWGEHTVGTWSVELISSYSGNGAGSDNDDEENDSWTPATAGAYVIGAAAVIGVIGVGAFVVVKAKAAAAVAAGGANMMGNGNVIGNTHFSPGQRQTSVVELGN
ncbi:Proprotein convertase subtilisin kexin type [Mactra antiquata]